MSSRSIEIHKEQVGEEYESMGEMTRDMIRAEVEHDKGRGHRLTVQVRQEGGRFVRFALFTGICYRAAIDSRPRFNRRALEKAADAMRDHDTTRGLIARARAELARRKAAGESY